MAELCERSDDGASAGMAGAVFHFTSSLARSRLSLLLLAELLVKFWCSSLNLWEILDLSLPSQLHLPPAKLMSSVGIPLS